MPQISRQNNFDLIRLIAALQVVIFHVLMQFKIDSFALEILKHFPGVPVFFALSGFLIPMSYQNSKGNLKKYFYNRFLRIYPALWVCFFITVILLFCFQVIHFSDFGSSKFWIWLFAQLSFFQFYDNDLVQSWGIGSPNGSLWSIAIELQFYFFVPLLFWVFKKLKRELYINILLIAILFFSLYFHDIVADTVWWFCVNVEGTPKIFLNYVLMNQVIGIILFNHLAYFIIGIFIYLYFDKVKPLITSNTLFLFFLYIIFVIIWVYLYPQYKFVQDANIYALIASILLISFAFSAAFTNVNLSEKLLKGNDISYGVYIYHMLIVNSIYGTITSWNALSITLFVTIICAWFSWKLIEKPLLKFKN